MLLPLFACLTLFLQSPAPAAASGGSATIIIDGKFDDWNSVPVAIADPADAPDAFVDLGEIRATSDGRFVHLLIALGRTVNAQGLDGTASILLDADGDPATGSAQHDFPGVDLVIDLTPSNAKNPGSPGMGMGLRLTAGTEAPGEPGAGTGAGPGARNLSVYDIGLTFAPTHAGPRMEYRIDRRAKPPGAPVIFHGDHFAAKIVYTDLAGAVRDETEAFICKLAPLGNASAASSDDAADPLAQPQAAMLRVMSWNAERGVMFTKSDATTRIVQALRPDVILLQELTGRNSREQLESLLNAMPGEATDSKWTAIFGEGGGDLRCAIASTKPLDAIEPLKLVSHANRPERSIRAIGGVVGIDGKRVLVVSLHLKCCGSAGGPEDQTREAEVQEIHKAVQAAIAVGGIDAVIMAGDFNLVGARAPLEMMASHLDFDRTDLGIADPYQLDGLSNTTWESNHQPFAPGRLDFLLFSDSSLAPARAFVYDARDLSPRWLQHYGARSEDTAASDHLPVVVDLKWAK